MKPNLKQSLLSAKAMDPTLARLVAWSRDHSVRCEARAEKSEILIMGPILDTETAEIYRMFGLESAIDDRTVYNELQKISGDSVDVLINSPGGDVFTGLSIMNVLKSSGKTINVKVLGEATSAASVVAMAGDTITMGLGSMMMIHRAWAIYVGNAIDFEERAKTLRKVDDSITDVYQRRTGMDREKIIDMLVPDTYMTADEAVEMGFADEVAELRSVDSPAPVETSARASSFGNFFLGRR